MTPDEIRQLGGLELTTLALELGLCPNGTTYTDSAGRVAILDVYGLEFLPHERLRQADAVFRLLRERGWDTFQRHGQTLSFVSAVRWETSAAARDERRVDVAYGQPGQDTEPLALLRCAVLAVASEQEAGDAR